MTSWSVECSCLFRLAWVLVHFQGYFLHLQQNMHVSVCMIDETKPIVHTSHPPYAPYFSSHGHPISPPASLMLDLVTMSGGSSTT
jgi:hypothetical protein